MTLFLVAYLRVMLNILSLWIVFNPSLRLF